MFFRIPHFAVDPHVHRYAATSSYSYALNSPLYLKDADGRDVFVYDAADKLILRVHNNEDHTFYQTNFTVKSPVITTDFYADDIRDADALIVGGNGALSYGVSGGTGWEIVIFTRGPNRNIPKFYGFWSFGLAAEFLIDANRYYGYGYYKDCTSENLKTSTYEGPFYTWNYGMVSRSYGTEDNTPMGKTTWSTYNYNAGTGTVGAGYQSSWYIHQPNRIKKIDEPPGPKGNPRKSWKTTVPKEVGYKTGSKGGKPLSDIYKKPKSGDVKYKKSGSKNTTPIR